MPKPKGGLGRGLSSLIPQDAQEPIPQPQTPAEAVVPPQAPQVVPQTPGVPVAGMLQVTVESISANPHQPRDTFGQDELEELAASIREHGLLQPLVVAQTDQAGHYNLIAGERRWRAAMLAGLDTIPVVIREASSREMLELALVENLQRADLNPLEEAMAYRSLTGDFGMKQEEVAARVGKSRGAVSNALRLLRLPPTVLDAVAAGTISEGHARALLQVPDLEAQLIIAERIIAEGLSVRQVEALARRLSEQSGPDDEAEGEGGLYNQMRDLEEQFRNALGTKVQLSKSRRGGRLVIYFYSDEELDRIYGAIVGDETAEEGC